MTVRELIEKLQELDGDLHVLVSGYEGGYCDVSEGPFEIETFDLDVNTEWYYGPHEMADDSRHQYKQVKGVVL